MVLFLEQLFCSEARCARRRRGAPGVPLFAREVRRAHLSYVHTHTQSMVKNWFYYFRTIVYRNWLRSVCNPIFLSKFYGKRTLAILCEGKGKQSTSVVCPKYTRFAWAGGTCPRFAWAGGIFSPVILLCQFLVLAGNRFWIYILLMYLGYRIVPYSCGVVLVFWFWREIVFGVTYKLSNLY